MKYWTVFQNPLHQAAFVVDGEIKQTIPHNAPKTPANMVGAVGEFEGNLIIARKASVELWTPDGSEQLKSLYYPWFYGIHAVKQVGNEILVVSSGLDLMFITDWDGNVSWEWWGWKHGLCGKPTFIDAPNWTVEQVNNRRLTVRDGVHMNSATIDGDKIYTSFLKRNLIVQIPLRQNGFGICEFVSQHGCHCPVKNPQGTFIYGLEKGIHNNGQVILSQYEWVKYITPHGDGYAFTHQSGVTFVDERWAVKQEHALPMPFGLALIEK